MSPLGRAWVAGHTHDDSWKDSTTSTPGVEVKANRMIIMRGLPGSGKSTTALRKYPRAWIVSADHFFMNDGSYKFDATQLGAAHNSCFREAMSLCQDRAHQIVVDNTNTTRAEYTPYVALARAYGYDVSLLWVSAPVELCIMRNVHGVPAEVIRAMYARWEQPTKSDPIQNIETL